MRLAHMSQRIGAHVLVPRIRIIRLIGEVQKEELTQGDGGKCILAIGERGAAGPGWAWAWEAAGDNPVLEGPVGIRGSPLDRGRRFLSPGQPRRVLHPSGRYLRAKEMRADFTEAALLRRFFG